ncbi:class II fructose-1,6-bisphosphate aldolase [Patescibacteria group bacterium]|nr:class II fructose-1,6-bisphosphate aldolase [Patescibacteria group bacterium]MBU1705706.1 class II fructose-1,6-bisphosphate aldolase [Patescibacteria group bacterium]
MLVTLKEILTKARRGKYAVGAFNVNNLEAIQAVIAAAEAEKSPVIISTSEGALEYAGLDELGHLVHLAAHKTKVPVVFHLDHGKNLALVEEVIDRGYHSSIMYDGSALPYQENVAHSRRFVKLAHAKGISVETEIGALAGIEDFVSVQAKDAHLTDPIQAKEFVRLTGCDALAVAIGTSHGAYKFKGNSKLDFKRLKEIAAAVQMPLVLHGASGVPAGIKKQCLKYGCQIAQAKGVSDANIRRAVSLGITKVNIDTDLRLAFDAGLRKFLKENPEVIDPRKILGPATELMVQVIRQKMKMLKSSGQA